MNYDDWRDVGENLRIGEIPGALERIKGMLDYDRPLVGALLHLGEYLGRIAAATEVIAADITARQERDQDEAVLS